MSTMRAVQVVGYHQNLEMTEVPVPTPTGPFDVIVKIGGAGVCRTDLHILEGQWAEKSQVQLPYTIGHENAGWVDAVGSAVTNVARGRQGHRASADHLRAVPRLPVRRRRALRGQRVSRHRHQRRLRRLPEDVGAQRGEDRRRAGTVRCRRARRRGPDRLSRRGEGGATADSARQVRRSSAQADWATSEFRYSRRCPPPS